MPNTKPYNKEEVMKKLKTRFFSEIKKEDSYSNFLGEDDKYVGPVILDGKFDFNFLTDFLSTALTLAEQAGEERMREKVYKNVGQLRQWLNEKPKDLIVTNEAIKAFLEI